MEMQSMSDTVLITLIVAISIVIVLLLFRKQLSRFLFKASREGVEAQLETRDSTATPGSAQPIEKPAKSASINIVGNRQLGKGNTVDVERSNVNVTGNTQEGQDNVILVKPEEHRKT
jgi:hypothetical protein